MTSEEDIGTGTGNSGPEGKVITVSFGNYDITLRLGPSDEFLEIVTVAVNKDFLTPDQKIRAYGSHDVKDLY